MKPVPHGPGGSGRGMKRQIRRILPPLAESGIEEPDAPARNAWPAGLRTMACLACDAPFPSSGRHERMCQSCRRHTL